MDQEAEVLDFIVAGTLGLAVTSTKKRYLWYYWWHRTTVLFTDLLNNFIKVIVWEVQKVKATMFDHGVNPENLMFSGY